MVLNLIDYLVTQSDSQLHFYQRLILWSNKDESWYDPRSENLHESHLNSLSPIKQEQELHEGWWELTGITACIAKTLINSHQNLNLFKVDESLWESMNSGLTRALIGGGVYSYICVLPD